MPESIDAQGLDDLKMLKIDGIVGLQCYYLRGWRKCTLKTKYCRASEPPPSQNS